MKQTYIRWLMTGAVLCLPLMGMAQDAVIAGRVSDSQGDPVVGAAVVVKGTTTGTTTDINGDYNITAPQDATLTFTFLGMQSVERALQGDTRVDVVMGSSEQSIEEVVVVGYGTMKKKDLTGSITQVRPDRIADENPKTVQDVLRGLPGVRVGFSTDAKGGGGMQIRGQRSVYTDGGHNDPLIILDGMMFYGELSEINPDDIEQIDILKDASAAAIYGAKAANGAVIIVTKKGKKGEPQVNITTSVGFMQKSAGRGVMSPDEYMMHRTDYYKSSTYGLNTETGAYEAYVSGQRNKGYYDNPANLSKYGVSVDEWRAYTNASAELSDKNVYATRIGLKPNLVGNYDLDKTYDWYTPTYRTGFNQDYNASVSGGSDGMHYYLSMGYLNNQGAILGNDYSAIRSNVKVEGKVKKWLEVGANINFQDRSDGDLAILSSGRYYDVPQYNSPYAAHEDADGNLTRIPTDPTQSPSIGGNNYEFDKQYYDLEKGYTIFNTILNAKVTLPFNVTYSFNASPRYQYYYNRYFMSAEHPSYTAKQRGVDRSQSKRFDWSLNNIIAWDYTFKEKHHTVLTLVQEAESRNYWYDLIQSRNLSPSDALGFHNTQVGKREDSSFSTTDERQTADALLARLFYAYDNRYMLTASIRRDGYSAFGSNNPYATFPSVSAAWTFTNEEFFKWKNILSTGKLRISYGMNGNRSLADPYIALANLTLSSGGGTQGYVNLTSGQEETIINLMASRMANPNLQWEKTQAWNFGLDYGFLNDRITGSIEYYNMNTIDMIMSQPLPTITGFSSITTNLGEVLNRGFELSVSSVNINNSIMEWRTTLGVSYNHNEIKHLFFQYEDILDDDGNIIGSREMDYSANNWFIGHDINSIWNYRVTGIWQANEVEEAAKYGQKPGDPKVANNYTKNDRVNADGTTSPVYDDKDKEFLGTTVAPWHWSLRNEFTLWKSLAISFNIYSYMGHSYFGSEYMNNDNDVSLFTYGFNVNKKNGYWTPENPTNDYARLGAAGPSGGPSQPGKIQNRSFIRLENVSVSYTLPQRWTKKVLIDKAKIYGSVRNVGVWALGNWEYGDPETYNGSGQSANLGYATRIYTLGLNLTF